MALDWVQRTLQSEFGFFPYPATLNLRLESEKEMSIWRQVKSQIQGIDIPRPDSSFCQARCFLVKIESEHQGAVLLPEVQGYPEDKVEVIAPVRLKDQLRVRDGDRITLEFLG
jgi:CTP-dependent riboflavin kinase